MSGLREPLERMELEAIRSRLELGYTLNKRQREGLFDIIDRAALDAAPGGLDVERALLTRAMALLSEWTFEVGDTEPRDANTVRLIHDIRDALAPVYCGAEFGHYRHGRCPGTPEQPPYDKPDHAAREGVPEGDLP